MIKKPGGPAPLDRVTGVPLLLSPSYMAKLPPNEWDDNHVMHSRRRPELMDDLGMALRRSRVQLVHHVAHRGHFHKHYNQPIIGSDDESRMQSLVVHMAGYIPEVTIAFAETKGLVKAVREPLHRRARNRLLESGSVRVYDSYELSKFLGRHLFEKYLVDETRQELVHGDPREASDLAEDLLRSAVSAETNHIEPLYERLQQERRIPRSLPNTAGEFVLKFMQRNGLPSAYDVYADYVASQGDRAA